MINLQLSVREAMNLATNCNLEIYERIVTAFEVALGVNQRCTVTITGGMTLDNRIKCIKAIRHHSGWDLKTAKDWTDVLVGGWSMISSFLLLWVRSRASRSRLRKRLRISSAILLRKVVRVFSHDLNPCC